jgi:hypothetical protein
VVASVHPIRTDDKLSEFFDFMFGETEGYAYSPTLHPLTKDFEQYFFQWPSQKEELINHVRRFSPTHNIYYSPALYSRPEATKDAFLGTWFVWAEFDGTVPATTENVPEPSVKIQSSEPGYEHWYWKLKYFISDIKAAEQISKRLTYHMQADLSIWNANRVLRPPDTIHHESSRQTTILRWSVASYGVEDFAKLPDVEAVLLGEDDNIGDVPEALDVIFKYPFSEEDARFFKLKEIKPGYESGSGKGRSAALARLGHICAEMGMSSAESLALLLHADNRWGKYSGRRDQRHRLLGIISYARAKHPVNPIAESPLKVYTLRDFMSQSRHVEWLVEGFIHRKGFAITFGPRGTGKSSLLIRACEAFSLGKKWLKWSPTKPLRVLYISLEMPDEEIHEFITNMKIDHDNENFMIMPLGLSMKLGSAIAKDHLNRVVETHAPDIIYIDSFNKAVGEDVTNFKVVVDVVDYIDTYLRLKYGCAVHFIHHPRKGQPNNKRTDKVDDMFGAGYLGDAATNITSLWKGPGGMLKMANPKMRLAPEFEAFNIRRTVDMNFEVIEGIGRRTEGVVWDATTAPKPEGLSGSI